MANISSRKNKDGKIVSYRIRVARGYDACGNKLRPFELTWAPPEGMTARQTEKELNRVAVEFEQQCKAGLAGNGKQKFSTYADYVVKLKAQSGELRRHTLARYQDLLKRINAGIGHIKLCDLRPQHLNALYEQLAKNGLRRSSGKATLRPDAGLPERIHVAGYTSIEKFLKECAGISATTYKSAVKGRTISADCAKKLANALNTDVTELFTLERDMRPLSAKTVREHHALIHVILRQAEQELLVPYNAADKAKPPKVDKTHANYFEQDEITAILEAAEQEPLKWRLLLHLMLVTGGRRGEILGLTWDNVDFVFSKIHIEKCVYYEKEIGIYVDKPKTERSVRYIRLPAETMQLIARYRDEYYEPLKAAAGDKWQGEGFLFVSDTGDKIGRVMHPDSVTGYCDQFAERYGLRHIDPHAFRHTSASILYFAGVDSISISAHLGHAKVSTTTDLYSHVIAEAQSRVANVMGDIILTTRKPLPSADSAEEKKREETG